MNTRIPVEARVVSQDARLGVLPRHFGKYVLLVEERIYDFMAAFAKSYRGGSWDFIELSNRGFYMRPPQNSYELRIDSNGFEGQMSADAAGITVCLFTFSHLSFHHATDLFTNHFHWLRDYAVDHAEATAIFAAID